MVAMRNSSGMALAVGRFAGWEPLGFEAGDENWYRFVENGPIVATDPMGLCEPGATEIHIRDATIRSLHASWTLMTGKKMISPLSEGVPDASAVGTALAKALLSHLARDLTGAKGIGKAIAGAFRGVEIAPKLFIDELAVYGKIDVILLERKCVEVMEPCWWICSRPTGRFQWVETERVVTVPLQLAHVDLRQTNGNTGMGVLPNDQTAINTASNEIARQLMQYANNNKIVSAVTEAIRVQFPKATVTSP